MALETMYDRICIILRNRDETASHMCDVLGLRRAMISDLKSGRNKSLSAKNLSLIAEYLHVTCDYLINGTDFFASLPLDEINLLNAWRLASDTEKENVMFILRNRSIASQEEKTKLA